MIIVHQSRQGITNLDACKTILLNGKMIDAHYIDGTKKTIAFYEELGRATEVFEELLYEMFPQNIEMADAAVWYSHVRNRDVFYLPEE